MTRLDWQMLSVVSGLTAVAAWCAAAGGRLLRGSIGT